MIALGTGIALLGAVAALRFVPFDNDISVMLPGQPEILRTFRFFREAPFTRNVLVSFELKEGSLPDLIRAVDQFTGKINSPMITHVLTGADSRQSLEGMREFVRFAPQLMDENGLKEVDSKLNAGFIREKLKSLYHAMLSPAGSFMLPVMQQDPLGLQGKALQDLRSLAAGSDYDVQLQEGHLISRDGRHALAVLETAVPVTDGFGARKLIDYLQGQLAGLPANISADLITGHLHSLSNEKIIKRDIVVTTSVTSLVFLLLFLFLFKDLRALLLFVTPSISVLISIPLCAWIMGRLSYIIMGMGAVISGIAVDYCIHVYVAMQSGQTRKAAIGEIAKPVISGALTTAGVFAVFLFSGVPGNRQLALFTVVSTFLSLGLALLIFPHFLVPSGKREPGHALKEFSWKLPVSWDGAVIGVWAVILLACAAALPFVHFRMDVKQYDGSEKAIFQAEEKFHQDWGGKNKPAMLVIEAPSFEEALETGHRIRPEILSVLGRKPFTGLSQIWPAERGRLENLARWKQYWKGERTEKIRNLIKTEGAAYNFSDEAFDSFFQMLDPGTEEIKAFEEMDFLRPLKRRFAFETAKGWQLVHFFPDEEGLVKTLSQKSRNWPGVFTVSAKNFEALLSKTTLSEACVLSLAIMVILPVLAFLFLRNVPLVLISLIPVASSILFIFGTLAVFKLSLNVASVIAILVVGGFSIDYGTFVIHQNEYHLKTNTHLAVTLSALTALFGAGALVFAKHPVLFSYGTSMVAGIVPGYASAVFVVPAFYRLLKRRESLQPA